MKTKRSTKKRRVLTRYSAEDRKRLIQEYRASGQSKALHNRAPALLRQPDGRIREYDKEQLNVPIGAVARNPLATENANARDFGWRQNKHSDHIMVEIGADEGNAWFPEIWRWYDKFLGDHRYDGLPSQAPRIPLGEE